MTTDTIALTEDMRIHTRWSLRLAKWIFSLVALTVGLIVLSYFVVQVAEDTKHKGLALYEQSWLWLVDQLPKQYAVQVIKPDDVPIEQLINLVSHEFKINPLIVRAMAEQESGTLERTSRVRFEPHLMGRFKVPANLNDIERQLYSSSHGLLQVVFGFHYKRCGLGEYDWDRLHDPLTNLRCGLTVLRDNLESPAIKRLPRPADRLRAALARYNGSEEYADQVMARLAALLIINLGDGV